MIREGTGIGMFLITLLNGLTIGSLLFIMAIGLNLSFGLLRIVNLSHGAFYLLGGYIGLWAYQLTGRWVMALIVGGLALGAVALIQERLLLRRVRGNATSETLVTLAVAMIISDLTIVLWGGNPKLIRIPGLLQGFVTVGTQNFPIYNVFVFCFAVLLALVIWLILKKTRIGMIIRAGVDNYEITATLGINIQLIFSLVFTAAGIMAGIAGFIGGTFLMVAPGEDWRILSFTLLVVIMGGMGSFAGTIVGSLIIGIILSITSAYFPQFSLFLMFAPVAVLLVVKPNGLFGKLG